MNATIACVLMMMMFLVLFVSPLYASEVFKDCSPCDHGMEASPRCICKNPIKGSMYFPHASLKDVNKSTTTSLVHGLTKFLKASSNLHVESVSIRNTTTDVSLQNLKVDISVFPLGKENFTQRELDVIVFALSNETYKAPAILGSYYYKSHMYIYLHGEAEDSDSPDRDAMIIKAVSSGFGILLMFITAGALYVLRKKMIAMREVGEHNVERAFNCIEMLEAMSDMI